MAVRPVSPVAPLVEPDDAADAKIRALQDRLLQIERDMKRAGDPSAEMFGAMSGFAAEMHQHRLEMRAMVLAVQRIKQPAASFSPQQVNTLGRHLAAECAAWAPRLRQALDWRTSVVLACALIAALMIGGIGGYRWRDTNRPDVTEVTNCRPAPQLDGGQAVACTFWIHPPTPGQH